MADPTKEELVQLVNELRQELDKSRQELEDRDNDIQDLTQELDDLERNQKKKGKSKGGDDELESYRAENDVLREKQEQDSVEISKLRDLLADANAKCTHTTTEKTELEAKVRLQNNRIVELENEILEVTSRSKTADLQRQEFNKQKNMTVKQTNILFEENEGLRDQIKTLKDSIQKLEENQVAMEEVMAQLSYEKDELSYHHDNAQLFKDDLQSRIFELEHDLENVRDKLHVSQDAEVQWEGQVDILKNEYQVQREQTAAELKRSASEIQLLQRQIVTLNDSTLVGEKQKHITELQLENKDSLQLLDEMRQQLEIAVADKAKLAERIISTEENMDRIVAERVVLEKERSRHLERKLEGLSTRVREDAEHAREHEVEKTVLSRELDELSHWRAVYEAGHGLQELARHQKKLKNENRSLGVAIEQMSHKLNQATDVNAILLQAFDKLRAEAGKDPNFMYPEYELQEEMMSDNARLKAQMGEMDDQVTGLESENMRLRKALKNQAGTFGEQGFKYAGMSADLLMKVNEFAANLRDGAVELPVDDRSRELLKDNKKLKDDLKVLQLQVERYERELGTTASINPSSRPLTGGGSPRFDGGQSSQSDAEIRIIRQDMQKLLHENSDLHAKLTTMQGELVLLLRQNNGRADGQSDNIASMLIAHNEAIMKEVQDVKQAYGRQSARSVESSRNVEESIFQPNDISMASVSGYSRPVPGLQLHLQPSAHLQLHSKNTSVAGTPRVAQMPVQRSHAQAFTPMRPTSERADLSTAWTPAQQQQSMALGQAMQQQNFMMTARTASAAPATPHGKLLLTKNLAQMKLPPEEWTGEVKELNAQLVECIEQLYEREEELEHQSTAIATLEDNLIAIKQQMAAVYHDYAAKCDSWAAREEQYKSQSAALHNDNEDLRLTVARKVEVIDNLMRSDSTELNFKVVELSRKVTIYEVNESVLTRKFVAQAEQLQLQQENCLRLEADFAEMESTLKKRILQLEEFKLTSTTRLNYVQARFATAVPQDDYLALQTELECLREDHLGALRREVGARVAALNSQQTSRELRAMRIVVAQLQAELTASKATVHSLAAQLEHQKETTQRALTAVHASPDLQSIVSEMGRFRGETARLEVDIIQANRRSELLMEQIQAISKELDAKVTRIAELELLEEDSSAKESRARKDLMDISLKYEGGGLTQQQAHELTTNFEKLQKELDTAVREAARQREVAEIASQQAQTLATFKHDRMDELNELREHCTKLECRSEDDILIGKLQRQLMSTKASYKAFARKYHLLRDNMRKRELAIRILETRLDQRHEAVSNIQDACSIEISSLKKALRTVSHLTIGDTGKHRKVLPFVTVGEKMMTLSEKVDCLAKLAHDAVGKAEKAEGESARVLGINEDLLAEKDLLLQRCGDLDKACKGTKQQTIASRINALYDDVETNKLTALQQGRLVQTLRQEKKYLQNLIASMEANVEDLEMSKVRAETKSLLAGEAADEHAAPAIERGGLLDTVNMSELASAKGARKPIQLEQQLLQRSELSIEVPADGGDAAAMMPKLQALSDQLLEARKAASHYKIIADKQHSELGDLESQLHERCGQVEYYERVMTAEGLPIMNGSQQQMSQVSSHRQFKVMRMEQDKLQEAASATIGSLRSLLDEKNKALERLQSKVEELQSDRHGQDRHKTRAGRQADELLQNLREDDDETPRHATRHTDHRDDLHSLDHTAMQQKLMDQLTQAEQLLLDKAATIRQFEQKCAALAIQCERAEARCGDSIKEMEAMQDDMQQLARHLQKSQERCKELATLQSTAKCSAKASVAEIMEPVPVDNDLEKKVAELTRAIKTNDKKLKSYRQIIVKLKDEFIKSEEESALAQLAVSTSKGATKDVPEGGGHVLGVEEMRELRAQVSALRDGLRQAKEDLEKARVAREKLAKARQAAQDEAARLEDQVGRAEAQATLAQDSLLRLRKELEESRRKESRIRDKLKEVMETNALPAAATVQPVALGQLTRDNEVLKAQNLALRRALEQADTAGELPRASAPPEMTSRPAVETGTARGHVLGGGVPDVADDNKDDVRQQMHAKWENEKKLQKRVSVLEKRLQEKIDEHSELQTQLQRARDSAQAALHTKDELQKKSLTGKQSAAQEAARGGVTAEEVAAHDQANAKIFELEDENALLRRQIEVDLTNEISGLKHQLSSQHTRVLELEREQQLAESRRKRVESSSTHRTLRESEDRYMREERLADELSSARRQRQDLEAALLERDALAMENKFASLAAEQEVQRLKRRVRELDASLRASLATATASSQSHHAARPLTASAATAVGTPGPKRERELEAVVDAMTKVLDKLKADNERLRKGATAEGGERRAAEADKRAAAEKKRADKLQDDFNVMQAKFKVGEESSIKLVQKQQQIAVLRKQLKTKDDDAAQWKDNMSAVVSEKETLQRRLSDADSRIQQLELALQQQQLRPHKETVGNSGSRTAASTSTPAAPPAESERHRERDRERERELIKQLESARQAQDQVLTQLDQARHRNQQLEDELESARLRTSTGSAALLEENEKLKQELSAFDLDFFEEIENLKYSHAEAVRKLRLYESGNMRR